MGLRYRKSIRLAPGLKLNLNAQSVSLTGGVPGMHLTYNSKGYRTASVGAPGTGFSYRTTKRTGQPSTSGLEIFAALCKALFLLVFYLVIGTFISMMLGPPWWAFVVVTLGLSAIFAAVRRGRAA